MTREEARNHLTEWLDEKMWRCFGTIDREAIGIAVEALSEPINCVKCERYYETEEDGGIEGHCRMDTAHTDLIRRADAIDAKPEYRNEDMWDKEKSTYNKGWNDCNDAWVAIIKALPSADVVSREEYEEVKAYMNTLVDAFIEDRKELAKSIKVVRCNECEWYQGVHGVQGHAPCEWFNKQVLWNDFCSNGEPYKGGDTK